MLYTLATLLVLINALNVGYLGWKGSNVLASFAKNKDTLKYIRIAIGVAAVIVLIKPLLEDKVQRGGNEDNKRRRLVAIIVPIVLVVGVFIATLIYSNTKRSGPLNMTTVFRSIRRSLSSI